jgi:excisionase family DNA binding protein
LDRESEWLTVEQTAELLGVGRRAVYKYAQQGRLEPYKRGIGRRTYFRRADVEQLRQFRPMERKNRGEETGRRAA